MKKEYNLRSNKCATQDSDSDSDYETEETESEFVTESESESENESDDPLSVNITFTIANNEESESEPDDIVDESQLSANKEIIDKLLQLSEEYKHLPISKELTIMYKSEHEKHANQITKLEKDQKTKNTKNFESLLLNTSTSDSKYFKHLPFEEQEVILGKLKNLTCVHKKPLRIRLIESDIPDVHKIFALKKIEALKTMSENEGEYYKIKNWVDAFMDIPFGVYCKLPISLEDGPEKCHEFMEKSKLILDEATYGLNDAKMQIMQYIGQLISNPNSIGTSIAFEGPMGTGKTTLVKEGISKILNRPFSFFALGGATDSSSLEGHSITYEGSVWGRIVDTLKTCKCMNPVFYFDELDKVSDTPKGEEIIGILTHLTDTSQNSAFHDKYFSEIEFDLSRALFIFSYNDISKVNPILRDRMFVIRTEGYTPPQKMIIAKKYLSPVIRNNVNFRQEDIIITDEALHYIIEHYTYDEKGVRNLKRCIENIYTKLNLFRLMKPDTNLFEKELTLNVSFPFTVTVDILKKIIKPDPVQTNNMMYI